MRIVALCIILDASYFIGHPSLTLHPVYVKAVSRRFGLSI